MECVDLEFSDFFEGWGGGILKNSYKSVETSSFLLEIPKSVTKVIESWIEKGGFPVIDIDVLENNEYNITQKRFLRNPMEYDDELNHQWTCSLSFLTDISKEKNNINFKEDSKSMSISFDESVKWYICDTNYFTLYRVNYNIENWEALISALIIDSKVLFF
uniref:Uncharacterized protein n=1 Tax=Megaselia scalaris TaxID=36166 RepID=T1GD20_MEGSC